MIFSWNVENWRLVWGPKLRLPSALLLAGPAGLGKGRFAQALAQAALCTTRTDGHFACGQCHSCRLFAATSHPDLRIIDNSVDEEPQQDGATSAATGAAARFIQVQRIRELREFHELSS